MSNKKNNGNSGEKNTPEKESQDKDNKSASEEQEIKNTAASPEKEVLPPASPPVVDEKQPIKGAAASPEKETVPPAKPPEVHEVIEEEEGLCRVLRQTFAGGDELRPDELIAAPKTVVAKLVEDGAADDSEPAVGYCESLGVKPRKIGEKRQPKKSAVDSDAAITD